MLAAWNAMYADLQKQLAFYPSDARIDIGIGNEVNIYLSRTDTLDAKPGPADTASPANAWEGYIAFFNEAQTAVSGRLATVSTTYFGGWGVGDVMAAQAAFDLNPNDPVVKQNALLAAAFSSYMQRLYQNADFLSFTFYPYDPAAPVPSRSDVFTWVERAFTALATTSANNDHKKVVLQEVGLPSATDGSRLTTQADYVDAVFASWNTHKDVVYGVNFFSLHDFSTASSVKLAPCPSTDDAGCKAAADAFHIPSGNRHRDAASNTCQLTTQCTRDADCQLAGTPYLTCCVDSTVCGGALIPHRHRVLGQCALPGWLQLLGQQDLHARRMREE
jgi:hypothetical protein